MNEAFDPYLKWLGIRDPERPPNHYRLLGIDLFESDPDVIATAADRQMAHIRRYQSGRHAQVSQDLLNELAAAKLLLLNPEKKAVYDTSLQTPVRPGTEGKMRFGWWAALSAAAIGILAVIIAMAIRDTGRGKATLEETGAVADAGRSRVDPAVVPPVNRELPQGNVPQENVAVEQDDSASDPRYDLVADQPLLPAIPDPDLPRDDIHEEPPENASPKEAPWVTETVDMLPYEIRPTGTILDDIRQAIAEGDLEEARRELTASHGDLPEYERTAAGLTETIRVLNDFHLAVVAALNGSAPAKTRLEYGTSTVIVENVDASEIVLRSPNGDTKSFRADPLGLPPQLAASLAKHVLQKSADPHTDLKLGAFWAFDQRGNRDKAEVYLESARRLGADVDLMLESWQAPDAANIADPQSPLPTVRQDIPDQKDLERLWKQVKAELRLPARITTNEQRFKASASLLAHAGREKNAAKRYVCLDRALLYATQSNHTAVALKALDEIVSQYDVDVLETRRNWLDKLKSTTDSGGAGQVARAALRAMEESIAVDDYTNARRFLAVANATSKQSADPRLVARTDVLRERLRVLIESYGNTVAARRTLAEAPDDPVANAVMGRFLCFSKADFARGLPHLSHSNDELSGLAIRTLNVANDANGLLDVANGWWTVAEKLSGMEQSIVFSYAVAWYKKAEPRVSATQREHVRQRLSAAKTRGETPAFHGPSGW